MEPQFRFCTSADGTRIAYATYGSGPPLLYANTAVLSVDAQFRVPEARAYFDALAARVGLVLFDRRGTGASQREVDDLSPEAEAEDIAAVADAAGIRAFTLFADIATNPCLTYAISPEQRSRNLVLWSPLIAARPSPELAEMARVARRDWSYFRRLWASRLFPNGPVALQRAMGKAYKDTVTQEMAARRMDFRLEGPDVEELLPRVTAPVLLIHREVFPHAAVMRMAALPPHGQVAFVPGYPPTPYPDHQAIVDAVFDFMGLTQERNGVLRDGTSIILFTDVADSTALTERMGDAAFRAASRALDAGVRTAMREAGGTPVEGKVLGDGVMGVFQSASQAIAAARRCVELGNELPMHIGLHAGDVLREDDNVYGGAVNIASRICSLCAPGEILVSQTVRDLARTSSSVTFEDRGEQALKGIDDPVRVFAVRGRIGENPR